MPHGALNDMTRNGDVTNFTALLYLTFGALGGAENIICVYRPIPGGKATVSYTNRNYFCLRGMFTHSDSTKGWAFTASAGRYSHEGNTDGTF